MIYYLHCMLRYQAVLLLTFIALLCVITAFSSLLPCQVNFLDVLGCFGSIPEEKLGLVFEGLQREGLLQVRGL
jgi:hypothetical protein